VHRVAREAVADTLDADSTALLPVQPGVVDVVVLRIVANRPDQASLPLPATYTSAGGGTISAGSAADAGA